MKYCEMKDIFRKHEESRPKHHLIAHIEFDDVASWGKKYSLEARTYEVSSDNKAFQPDMGGYSIYGSSCDGSDVCVRLERYMTAEKGGKDGWKVKKCQIVGIAPLDLRPAIISGVANEYVMPEMCFTVLPSTGELIIIKKGESGYHRSEWSTNDSQQNREIAQYNNDRLGVTDVQKMCMEAGSMFGWDAPGANPVYYRNGKFAGVCTPAMGENKFFFALKDEVDEKYGCIGHLRIDFGHGGKEFWTTWHQRGVEEWNGEDFKREIDPVVNTLRRTVLKDLTSMKEFCHANGGEIPGEWTEMWGYVTETDKYRYFLRCIPKQGEYNAYLTCFRKDLFDAAIAADMEVQK